jgi:hypothetical protein
MGYGNAARKRTILETNLLCSGKVLIISPAMLLRYISLPLALVASACGFDGARSTASPDGSPPATFDAAPPVTNDAPGPSCKLSFVAGSARQIDRVGGQGGDTTETLQCNPGQIPVGFRFGRSDDFTFLGVYSIHKLELRCATVSVDANKRRTIGPISTMEVKGRGNNNWAPATYGNPTGCPDSMLVGLKAHTGLSEMAFANISLFCRSMPTLSDLSTTSEIVVDETGDSTNNEFESQCTGDRVIEKFDVRIGDGVDSITSYCSKLVCN